MAGARNLLMERNGVVKAQGASIYILGWFALTLATVGGEYAATSWPGGIIRWFFELFPAWFIQIVLVIGFVAFAIDIINDLTPNRVAITYGFLGPILAASHDANGELAQHVREWSTMLRNNLGGTLGHWVGNVGAGPLAIALIVAASMIGRRVLQEQRGGGGR